MKFLRILSIVVPVAIKKIVTTKRLVLLLFLFGIFYYLYPSLHPSPSNEEMFFKHLEEEPVEFKSAEKQPCPEFPKSELFIGKKSLKNWQYIKDHPEYHGCTGLIYVNSESFPGQCKGRKEIISGEIFLFPGEYCRNDNCAACPKDKPQIGCTTTCPLTFSHTKSSMHQQLADLLTKRTSDFMGFAIKLNRDNNKLEITYNSYTCNPQWFGGDRKIGKCGNIDWKNELEKALRKQLKLKLKR